MTPIRPNLTSNAAAFGRSFLFIAVVAFATGAFSLSSAESFAPSTRLFAQDAGGSLDLSALDDVESTANSTTVPASDVGVAPDDSGSADPDSNAASSNSNSNESSASAPAVPATSERSSFVKLALAGGWIGAILLIASLVAASLAIRLCLALRRRVFLPSELETDVADALARADFADALRRAESDDSYLGRVLAAGLRQIDRGWPAVEKALEDAAGEEAAAIYRKTEPLSTIGNVAPMLGLLGTVVGMVATFGRLASDDGAGRDLANGIYFALVTTVDGLIVAIPALVAHSLLNARVASLVADAAKRIDRLFESTKRGLETPTSPTVPKPVQTPKTPAAQPQEPSRPTSTRPVQTAQPSRSTRSTDAKPAPAPVPGLQEIDAPRPGRPALSLKPKRDGE